MEVVAISALIIAVIGAIGAFVTTTHLKKCKGFCFESDCSADRKRTPPETPVIQESPATITLGDISV